MLIRLTVALSLKMTRFFCSKVGVCVCVVCVLYMGENDKCHLAQQVEQETQTFKHKEVVAECGRGGGG